MLVDPLAGVDAEERTPILDLLARLSPAVQVLYLTDDQTVVDWAERLGLGRGECRPVRARPGDGLSWRPTFAGFESAA